MTSERCSLAWKAAALEDGRLEGADGASFEDHATRCADCRAEQKALAALAVVAGELRGEPWIDLPPLARARQRGALLERANDRFLRPRRSMLPAFTFAGVLLAGALVVLVVRRGPSAITGAAGPAAIATSAAPEVTASPPRFAVTASDHAMWRAHTDGAFTRVDVADGEATFAVEPLTSPQRFLVMLPDGEAEVTAGRFTVDVALGGTRSVGVAEGEVTFRRRDDHEIVLNAGESWSRTASVSPVASVVRVASTQPAAPASIAGGASASSLVATRAPRTGPSPTAGVKFDEGIGSFVRGNYTDADVALRDFMSEFPHDARCEDAAFLSAVSRWRLGDAKGARERADRYLTTYPTGLRRAEAQHIVDAAR